MNKNRLSCPRWSFPLVCLIGFGVASCSSDHDVLLSPSPDGTGLDAPANRGNPQEYVALLQEGTTLTQASAYARQHGITLVSYDENAEVAVFSGNTDASQRSSDPTTLSFEIAQRAEIADGIGLAMGFMEGGWNAAQAADQPGLDRLYLDTVHDHAVGTGIRVAVLDTGADFNHPHLAGRVFDPQVPGLHPAQELRNHADDDRDGVIDNGYGHGTHVAGLILSCAPGARLYPMKVLSDEGTGTVADVAIALNAVLDSDIDIVNMSFSFPEPSETIEVLLRRIDAEGIVMMAAAGNDAGRSAYPASSEYVVSVAATGPSSNPGDLPSYFDPENPGDLFDDPNIWEMISGFSARGDDVQIAAPGAYLVSSFPMDYHHHRAGSGTSMASAVATGVWACIAGPHDRPVSGTPLERLFSTADDIYPDPSLVEHGRVSPTRALILFPTP